MSLQNRIEQKLTQKICISTQIVQSLKILNMGRQELEEEIEAESTSNPLLDVEIEKGEVDWESYFKKERNSVSTDKNDIHYNDFSEYDFENMTLDEVTLYDTLHGQINIMKISEKEKEVCNYLIDSLDNDGYLRESELSLIKILKVDRETLEECIEIVQSLEPPGIGARSLQECIILQLHDAGIYDEILEEMVNRHLNLVANSNVKQLAANFGIKKSIVIGYIELIKSLDPKPAQKYLSEDILYAYPDVVVEIEDGKCVAKAYNEKKISLGINQYYRNMLVSSDDENVKSYIREKLNSAKKMMNDVFERNSTIVNIANTIIDIQREFFEEGGPLKPMTLNDVSDRLDCHISTISRGVNDKYMLTSKGLFEFKRFFSTGYEKNDGGVVSSNSIKDEIKTIIEGEDKNKPLSDKKIEEMLKLKGLDIARRTVAKYREELGYLSSSKRKQI